MHVCSFINSHILRTNISQNWDAAKYHYIVLRPSKGCCPVFTFSGDLGLQPARRTCGSTTSYRGAITSTVIRHAPSSWGVSGRESLLTHLSARCMPSSNCCSRGQSVGDSRWTRCHPLLSPLLFRGVLVVWPSRRIGTARGLRALAWVFRTVAGGTLLWILDV